MICFRDDVTVAKTQGWKVDENEGVVEPVAKPTPPRETLGELLSFTLTPLMSCDIISIYLHI
jgi:hypothetical protein